jgi:hypothetical protein
MSQVWSGRTSCNINIPRAAEIQHSTPAANRVKLEQIKAPSARHIWSISFRGKHQLRQERHHLVGKITRSRKIPTGFRHSAQGCELRATLGEP